ncbi:MAG TPA: sugar phosphate isomerase/epimerase family protein [Armatimonadota bacterium]|nr:sugar phosphate isomerase/epimerase family protein [Armatimonadota bacterium]
MMKKSVVTANYVTRVFGYHPPQPFDWGVCDRATQERFSSPGWQKEWKAICEETVGVGLQAIEVWTAHLPYQRVDESHMREFAKITADYGLTVSAYAGWIGGPDNSRASFEKACLTVRTIGAPYVQGGLAWNKLDVALPVLREYGVRVTIENHPGMETPDQMLKQIAADPEWIGAGPDTGWFGVVGADAAAAIRQLGKHVWHVHWKDMKAVGSHDSCAMGYGVVGLDRVLDALKEIGYQGYLSLEHEPAEGDPLPDVRKGLEWLTEHESKATA